MVEQIEYALQLVDGHAVAVGLDLDQAGLVRRECRDRARVRGRLGDDHIAWVDERLAYQVDDLLTTGGDDHVVAVHEGVLGGHHV
jgi:hypothetical protein